MRGESRVRGSGRGAGIWIGCGGLGREWGSGKGAGSQQGVEASAEVCWMLSSSHRHLRPADKDPVSDAPPAGDFLPQPVAPVSPCRPRGSQPPRSYARLLWDGSGRATFPPEPL